MSSPNSNQINSSPRTNTSSTETTTKHTNSPNPTTNRTKSTTFKKRKKKTRQILKPSAPSPSSNNTKKRCVNSDESDEPIIQPLKRRKLKHNTNSFTTETTKILATFNSYKSDRSVLPSGLEGQGATVPVYIETKNELIINKPSLTSDGHIRYKGLKSQCDIRNDKSKPIKKAPKFLGIGPQRAPDNVKITCRFDYQPDICKDWKETGYCGYGASCKFLHDRTDYKAGWQIEKDWQKFMKKKQEQLAGINGNDNDNNDNDEEEENWEIHSSDDNEQELDDNGLPFACYICRNKFIDPVVTKCGHYFCSQCAIKQYRKSNACKVCGVKTEGSFKTATKLMKKIKKRKK